MTTLRRGRTYCAAVESNDCEAPAGFRTGAGHASLPGVHRDDLLVCGYCGERVCRPCSNEVDSQPVCLSHDESELMEWMDL